MRLRQEQIVFLVGLLLLGFLAWRLFGAEQAASRIPARGSEESLQEFTAPDVALVRPDSSVDGGARRALFAPPRDTVPLPPLELVEPPREILPGLFPPPVPGPAARAFGELLRISMDTDEVADLFAAIDEPLEALEDLSFLDEGAQEAKQRRSLIRAIAEAQEALEDPFAEETYAERYARIEGYKDRYDWIVRVEGGEPIYGHIANADRYGLVNDRARSSEALLFTEIDPLTGREVFESVGGVPLPYERDSFAEFHFARTFANQIELRRREIGAELTRGSFEEAIELADACVRRRLEAPRALSIARELYEMCAAFDPGDPAPRIGLARCFEAGFDFESAFSEYQQLIVDFAHRPAVHVGLARLEERFLLIDEAEARLRQALSGNRGSWEARWGLGRFLLGRDRFEEAVEHLRAANRAAPQVPELLHVRVEIRHDLATALFALGDAEEAGSTFAQALAADQNHERAMAGLLGTELLLSAARAEEPEAQEPGSDEPGAEEPAGEPANELAPGAAASAEQAATFELLLARGIAAIAAREWSAARDRLEAAAAADPLRANRALCALSYLAEVTGHPGEALGFVEEAIEVDPGDAWARYQRGRLLGAGDDYEGARASFLAALEQELDFEDALVALGDVAFRLGRFEDAERYLERAVAIHGERSEVHALRGLNLLRLEDVPGARASFEEANAFDRERPVALAGLAWCNYLSGDTEEALIQLGNLDELRRSEPEEDDYRVWAREQIERIQDYAQKVAWFDNFDRKRLLNEWSTREGSGPTVGMQDGAVEVSGVFDRNGSTTVYRAYNPGLFVAFEADVYVSRESRVRAGIFIARERRRRGADPETTMEASVSRHKEGALQVRIVRSGQTPQVTDMEQEFPAERWVRLRIERTGEGPDTGVTLSMDGIPLLEGASLPGLGRATSELLVGLFVEGENSRQAEVRMDNVEVVYRQRL